MAASRPRRVNAGANIQKLLNDAEEVDEFYKENYGGFAESDNDTDFADSDTSDDVVDSDFDLSENEPEQDDEANEKAILLEERTTKKKAVYKDPKVQRPPVRRKKMSDVNDLPKKTVSRSAKPNEKLSNEKYSRSLRQSTHQMTFDRLERENRNRPKKKRQRETDREAEWTQEELLEEAKITEIENTRWLEKFKTLEIEKTRKRPKRDLKETKDFTIQHYGYLETTKDPETGEEKSITRSVISFPTEQSLEQNFPKPPEEPKEHKPKLCWLTGFPARYIDPLTGIPYHSPAAFQAIRHLYLKYLEQSERVRDNEQVKEYVNFVKTEIQETPKCNAFGNVKMYVPFRKKLKDQHPGGVGANSSLTSNRTISLNLNTSLSSANQHQNSAHSIQPVGSQQPTSTQRKFTTSTQNRASFPGSQLVQSQFGGAQKVQQPKQNTSQIVSTPTNQTTPSSSTQSQQQQQQQQPKTLFITAVANNNNAYIIHQPSQDAANNFVPMNINSLQQQKPN